MAKGDFDQSVSQSGWFAPRNGGLTAASWFDRQLVADTTIEASGSVQLEAMAGTGQAAVAIAADGVVQLAPLVGTGTAVIGDVAINAGGTVTFAPMTGSGRLGIGSGMELREVVIVPRIVELRVTMRR